LGGRGEALDAFRGGGAGRGGRDSWSARVIIHDLSARLTGMGAGAPTSGAEENTGRGRGATYSAVA
jgi:hypothetical protein